MGLKEDRFCARCGATRSPSGASTPRPYSREIPGKPVTPRPAGATRSTLEALPAALAWSEVLERLRQATIGEYEVAGELGRGGMAAVYLAHDIALNRKVAIKVMSPALLLGAGMLERFKLEAQVVARLTHPHIVTIHAIREIGGLNFIVMKYIEGCPLDAILRRGHALPVPAVRSILSQVGSALAYAHRHGVVHRDVKPGNILMDVDGDAVVSDFGIAKVASATTSTHPGDAVGTPAYMSPEQCESYEVTPASDQYSLGIVAYELLTGAQPFQGSKLAIMRGQVEQPPPPILGRSADCPLRVVAAVERMLAKSPADRWPTVAAALAEVDAVPLGANDPLRLHLGEQAAKLATVHLGESRTPVSFPPVRGAEELRPRTPPPEPEPHPAGYLGRLTSRARFGLLSGAAILVALLLFLVFQPSEPEEQKIVEPPALLTSVELPPGGDLASALSRVADGGSILLSAGEYRLDDSLVLTRPVQLRGAGRDSTSILVGPGGGFSVKPEATQFELSSLELRSEVGTPGTPIIMVAAAAGVVADVRIAGPGVIGEDCGQARDGLAIGGASSLQVLRIELTGLCTGLQVTDSARPELRDNSVTRNVTGVQFFQASGGTVTGNRISGNHDGLVVFGGSPILDQNEIMRNRGFGYMGQAGSNARLLKNRITNNLGADIQRP
jgi:parallel beta-helix repeat protein